MSLKEQLSARTFHFSTKKGISTFRCLLTPKETEDFDQLIANLSRTILKHQPSRTVGIWYCETVSQNVFDKVVDQIKSELHLTIPDNVFLPVLDSFHFDQFVGNYDKQGHILFEVLHHMTIDVCRNLGFTGYGSNYFYRVDA